jgi:hypothetical protein
MLDRMTEFHAFVRIVGTGNLSAAAREMGFALGAVGKPFATREQLIEAHRMAFIVRYHLCGEYRVRHKQNGYEKSRRGKLVAGSWHRQHRALPNLSIHDPGRLIRRRRLGDGGSDAHAA